MDYLENTLIIRINIFQREGFHNLYKTDSHLKLICIPQTDTAVHLKFHGYCWEYSTGNDNRDFRNIRCHIYNKKSGANKKLQTPPGLKLI